MSLHLLYDLPEELQWVINKINYSETIVPCFKHKDWWFHTVKARSDGWKEYIDPEAIDHWDRTQFFSG
jgi:hypothetical protein